MRKLFFSLFIALSFIAPLPGDVTIGSLPEPSAPITVAWDYDPNNEGAEFRIYCEGVQVGSSNINEATVYIPSTRITKLTVSAFKWSIESDPSAQLAVVPVTPQTSYDMVSWTSEPTFFEERLLVTTAGLNEAAITYFNFSVTDNPRQYGRFVFPQLEPTPTRRRLRMEPVVDPVK